MEVRRGVRGATLLEILVVISLTLLLVTILGNVTNISRNSLEKASTIGTTINKSKYAFEKIVQDIRQADVLLSRYPVNSPREYLAEENKVIIIRQPVFDSSNDPITGQYNVIIYKLVSLSDPEQGPNVIKKLTATITNGVESEVKDQGIALTNVQSATIQNAINQQFWGDQSTTKYYLYNKPLDPTDEIPNQFLIGGVDRFADGKAVLSGKKVTLSKAMVNGVRADALYHGDPALAVDTTGSNGATSVFLNFVIRPNWKSIGHINQSRDFVFKSQPMLLNTAN